MKIRQILRIGLLVMVMSLTGCDTGGGPTGPTNAPVLTAVTANPQQAYPGAIIIFSIVFTDIPGDLNGGTAVITDNRGGNYQGAVSNAEGTSGTLTTSIELSPLITTGQVVFSIYVVDRAGNPSNIVPVTITIL